MNVPRHRVVIFAGAGASTAVSKEKFPTTVGFLDRLPDKLRSLPLFRLIVEETQQNKDSTADVETVLWEAELLKDRFEAIANYPTTQASGIVAKVLQKGGKAGILPPGDWQLGKLHEVARAIVRSSQTLSQQLNRQVFEIYRELPTEEELLDTWLPVLRFLRDQDIPFDVFTTNYDMVFESAAGVGGFEPNLLETGFRGGAYPRLDVQPWTPGKSGPPKSHLLTKLHGSINWTKDENDPERIYQSGPQFLGNDDRHLLIYPGFKGSPAGHPIKEIHDHLELCLRNATILMVVGFAFRDEYINDVFSRNVLPETRVLVWNPELSIPNIPFRHGQYQHLVERFGVESWLDAVRFMFEGTLSDESSWQRS